MLALVFSPSPHYAKLKAAEYPIGVPMQAVSSLGHTMQIMVMACQIFRGNASMLHVQLLNY